MVKSEELVENRKHVAKVIHSEKPITRITRLGPEALSDVELLSLFFNGRLPSGGNPIDLARLLLYRYGSISEIASLTIAQLGNENGMSKIRAAHLLAVFEIAGRCSREMMHRKLMNGAEAIYESVKARLAYKSEERVLVIMLDTKLQATRVVELSKGNANTALCEPRDVLHEVLVNKAPAFVLVHNHPSGDPSPSRQDIKLTKMIQKSCETMHIRFVDHLIVGRPSESRASGYYSFTAAGVL